MTKYTTTTKLIALIVAMLYVLAVLSSFTYKSYAADKEQADAARENLKNNLTTRQAVDIVRVNEEADLPATQMALQVVNEHERRVETERIEEEKKRIAKREKARKEAERKRKLAEKERLEKEEAELEAAKNTEETSGGAGGSWNGRRISRSAGAIQGPSGRETYYNLNMSGVVNIMRSMGYSEKEYPYEVRSDGVKTFGGYVMVAANLQLRPKGTLIETSVGTGIVVDTGGFAAHNKTQLDIATNW